MFYRHIQAYNVMFYMHILFSNLWMWRSTSKKPFRPPYWNLNINIYFSGVPSTAHKHLPLKGQCHWNFSKFSQIFVTGHGEYCITMTENTRPYLPFYIFNPKNLTNDAIALIYMYCMWRNFLPCISLYLTTILTISLYLTKLFVS